jgi:hypothetical protein
MSGSAMRYLARPDLSRSGSLISSRQSSSTRTDGLPRGGLTGGPDCHSVAASSWRATASSVRATSTRTPCAWSCGSCPPASSADTAALTPLLRNMPTISSASMRLGTAVMDTVAPSGRSGGVRPCSGPACSRPRTRSHLPRIGCRRHRPMPAGSILTSGSRSGRRNISTTGVPGRLSLAVLGGFGDLWPPFAAPSGLVFSAPPGQPPGKRAGEQHDRGGQPAGDPDPG